MRRGVSLHNPGSHAAPGRVGSTTKHNRRKNEKTVIQSIGATALLRFAARAKAKAALWGREKRLNTAVSLTLRRSRAYHRAMIWRRAGKGLGCLAIVGLLSARVVFAQGCIPAHYVSLSLGAQGISYLQPGQFQGDLFYRYLYSDKVFIGTEEQPQLYDLGGRHAIHSIDLNASYALTDRLALSLTLPFLQDSFSNIHGDGQRHSGSSSGLGDLRLVGSTWVFKPADHPNGNVNLGIGVKFPTGGYRETDDYFLANGDTTLRPVDIAAQPGDGGFGVMLQLQGYQKLAGNLFGYLSGYYMMNPRNENGTERPNPASTVVNSVPDQYLGRAGVSYIVWPSQGLSLSFGGRIDGIPEEDVWGDSDGFRRAGYAVYVEPGLNWSFGRNVLSVSVPVAVRRNLERTQYSSAGGFADYLVVAAFSHQF
jgi:hypothetical protein